MEQPKTIDFLRRLLGRDGEPVEAIETHISIVMMGQSRVFKLKRNIRLPYVDFSTPERRLAACEAEAALNRRTAPDLYVGAHRIVTTPAGDLAIDGEGRLIDAFVEMRRFGPEDLLDSMASSGRLSAELVTETACSIAKFHLGLQPIGPASGAASLRPALDANAQGLRACGLFDADRVETLIGNFDREYQRLSGRLQARADAGSIRRCHGDLHLRNICLYQGRPTLFDCLEFDEKLATIDVLYDFAFLLMDLLKRGLPAFANLVFNRYLDETEDVEHLSVMPLFVATRAVVRAHVTAAQANLSGHREQAAEADMYLKLAEQCLKPDDARLVAVGGLSGSGKSTLAAGLAVDLGPPPGARILSTDRIRKRLHGVDALTRLPADAYGPESSAAVYEAQRREAARVLAGGHSVIVDGVFLREHERHAVEAIAEATACPFNGFWLAAPAETLAARVDNRTGDPSDATSQVVKIQTAQSAGRIDWTIIDAQTDAGETLEEARRILEMRKDTSAVAPSDG